MFKLLIRSNMMILYSLATLTGVSFSKRGDDGYFSFN